jgi:hypothetical protein
MQPKFSLVFFYIRDCIAQFVPLACNGLVVGEIQRHAPYSDFQLSLLEVKYTQ